MKKSLFLLPLLLWTGGIALGQFTAPSNLTATSVSSSEINLTWKDNTTIESGFQVESSTNGSSFTKIADLAANTTSYASTGLSAQTKYFFRVRATSAAAGNSPYSNTADATTQATPVFAPNAPNNLTASTVSDTQINLNWSDNANNESGFQVESSTNGSSFTKIADLAANTTSYASTGLSAQTKYFFRVRATSAAAGNSPYSNTADATTQATPVFAPNAPNNLIASTASDTQINLNWSDNANNESGFQVESSTNGSSFTKIADLAANTTSYASTGLSAQTKYFFRVRATSAAAGNSPYSNTADATTQATPVFAPNAPNNLTASTVSDTQINLNWSDNANNESGFQVESSTNGSSFTKIADLAANTTSYASTGLSAQTKYFFRVRATSAAAGNSPYSNTADATTQATPVFAPNAPNNLTASTVSDTQINLNWSDNANNESGFQVESSTNGSSFTKIADLAANTTSYASTGLSAQTKYFFRVRATSAAAGNSPYSNTADATTQATPKKTPETPENLGVQSIDFELTRLNWNPLSVLATTVIIERSKNQNSGFVQIGQQSAKISEFFDKDILDITNYYYRIKATNDNGSSSYSNLAVLFANAIITSIQTSESVEADAYVHNHILYIKNIQHGNLQLFDLRGVNRLQAQINRTDWQTDLVQIETGVYIIQIETDNRVITKKILHQ